MSISSRYPEMKAPAPGRATQFDGEGSVISMPAVMNYVAPASARIMHIHRDTAGDDQSIEGIIWDPVEVDVYNGRSLSLSLHSNGFELVNAPLPLDEPIDFFDTQSVIRNYYASCERLLRSFLGEDVHVRAFDHNIRLNDRANNAGMVLKRGGGSKAQRPIGIVHGDYTRVSAPQRIRQLAGPPKANDVLRLILGQDECLLDTMVVEEVIQGNRRYALINVWRNIDPACPVKSQPLACIDAQSVTVADLRTLQIHYADRVGENYLPFHSHSHKWYYFPEMTIREALLIKQWDSSGGLAGGGDKDIKDYSSFSIHSAFIGPNEENTPPRQSIEVRCVCIWPA